jgi:hypothetical protein
METVKVDIQKLQLLNDRLAQTIEALNQVRLSVHGIQHSPAQVSPWGVPAYGYGAYGAYAQSPFAFQPSFGAPYTPYMTSPFAAPVTSPFPGIQHTPATIAPQTMGMSSGWTLPYAGNGLSHTSWDPTWQTRAFPWVQYPQWVW